MVFSDMLALMASWLSPSFLFILLNLMILTIFFISRFSPHKTPFNVDDYKSSPTSLQPSPSFLGRVKSFNFSTCRFPLSNYEFDHHLQPDDDGSAAHPLERAPSILERVKSFYKHSPQVSETDYSQLAQPSLGRAPSLLERVKSFYKSDSIKSNQMEPTVTDSTGPIHGEVKRVQPEPKVGQIELQEKTKKSTNEISRRKVKEEEVKTTSFEEDDHGVDAKADDFIIKFKQQLKMQRLDSLLRYRDMLKRK